MSSTVPSSTAINQLRPSDSVSHLAQVQDVVIQVTQPNESKLAYSSAQSFHRLGDSACCGSASPQTTRSNRCFARGSQKSCIATDIDGVAQEMDSVPRGRCSSVERRTGGDSDVNKNKAASFRLLLENFPRHNSGDLERRTSDDAQGQQHCIRGIRTRDLHLPGHLRSQRSCSDAGVHIASRTRAAAVAATARTSCLQAAHHCQHCQHHNLTKACHHHQGHKHHCHRSHSCIVEHFDSGSSSSVLNSQSCNRRAYSHSSVSKLGVRGHKDQESTCSLHRSERASSEEEEVTYVWKDGRVQVHHARSGLTTPDLSVSGQHVQYVWRNGNVQRVVRGSNHELLSAEVVPPRGAVKGFNYCTGFSLMISFVFVIAVLVFVLKMVH